MPTVEIPVCVEAGNPVDGVVEMDEKVLGHYQSRLVHDADRRSTNATTMDHILDKQYASSQSFRDATAARIALESGSGRTRAETNDPANTSAQRPA